MARDDVYGWTGTRTRARVGERETWLPAYFHDTAQFTTVHAASFDAVRRALPSDVVRPARWVDGSALVLVSALRHRHVTVEGRDGVVHTFEPYGEMVVAALVGEGRSRRALPFGRQDFFVLHMPVTTREAHDLGRAVWNFPTFVADMDFRESPRDRAATLSEGGSEILTMHVRPAGPVLPDDAPRDVFTAKDGALVRTRVPSSGHVQTRFGGRGGELSLGDHELAGQLRQLGIRTAPVVSYSYLDTRFLLPAGATVGPADPYDGLRRAVREVGRYTLGYPSTGQVDLYGDRPLTLGTLV